MAANTNALREGAIGPSGRATDSAAFDLTRLLPKRDKGDDGEQTDEKSVLRASPDDGATTQIEIADLFHLPRVAPRFEATRFAIAASASAALHAIALLGFVHFGRPAWGDNGTDQEIPIEIVIERSALPETAAAKTPEQPAERLAGAENAPQTVAGAPPETAPALRREATDAAPPPPPAPAQSSPAEPPPASAAAAPAQEPQTALEATPENRPDTAPTPRPPARSARDEQDAVRKAEQVKRRKRAEQLRALEEARAEERVRRARKQAERYAAEQEQRRDAARRSAARAEAEQKAERAETRRRAAVERGVGAGSRQAAAPGAHAAYAARANDFDAASYRALVAHAVRAAVGSRCSLGAGSRVVIALSIGRSGAISGASISSPSGNLAFDAASLAAVRRAGPFPPLQGRSGVSVPVGVACR